MAPSTIEELMEEVAKLRISQEEERLGREKERLGREKAERLVEEERLGREKERLGREKAERAAEKERRENRNTTIPELLDLYHKLSLTIEVETNPSVLTTGQTTKPAGRKYPKRIVPWDNFTSRQQEIWKIICASSTYSERLFDRPTSIQDKTRVAVRSEGDVVANEGVVVLEPVQAILQQFFKNEELRQQLELPGYVTFVNHLNLNPGNQYVSTLPKTDHLPLSSNPITPPNQGSKSQDAKANAAAKDQKYPKDIGGQADKFCIVKVENGQEKPVYNIEYKPPHKFEAADILEGLRGEILPARDLINKKGKSSEFFSQSLVSAVITQLFSYLVKTGVQYGYVSTGVMIIFLHISDDPEQVEYYVWDWRDFDFDQTASLHNTAIAEVIAFSLQALAAKPPLQVWHDAAAKLDTWAVEYIDILKSISETVQKERDKRDTPEFKPPGWKLGRAETSWYRSPIATRSGHQAKHIGSKEEKEEDKKAGSSNLQTQNLGCRPQDLKAKEESEDSADAEGDGSPIRPSTRAKRSNVGRAGKRGKGNGDGTVGSHTESSRNRVLERGYCSLPCLLGLANGGYLDPNCPNIADHGKRHLKRTEFLRLVRAQLARDRGHVSDCEPLWIGGSRGAMFKVTLTAHGYTVIAKGVQHHDVPHLQHEAKVYRHLRPIQGIHIPVCLGSTNLVLPYYHQGGKFVRFLFQSYAGVPVFRAINEANKPDILSNITHAMDAIHQLRVLHCDAMPRNIMTDEKSGWVQIVDFERAKIQKEVVSRKKISLRSKSANGRVIQPSSHSKMSTAEKPAGQDGEVIEMKDVHFNRELRIALSHTARCVLLR